MFFSIVCFVLLHSLVTIWNDIRDEAGDRLNGITRLSSLRSRGGLLTLYVCLVISSLAALSFTLVLPAAVSELLGLFVLLGWLYNDRPVQASHRPVLSLVILALSYGLVPFLLGTGLSGLNWKVIMLAVGWTCVRASLSVLKDYKDAPGDAASGKKTFLLVYGHSRVARTSLVLAAVGYLLCIAATELLNGSVFAGETLMIVAVWLVLERAKLFKLTEYAPLNQLFHSLLTYEIVFDGLVIAWLHSS